MATFIKLLFTLLSSDNMFQIASKVLDNYKALSPEQLKALKDQFEEINKNG